MKLGQSIITIMFLTHYAACFWLLVQKLHPSSENSKTITLFFPKKLKFFSFLFELSVFFEKKHKSYIDKK